MKLLENLTGFPACYKTKIKIKKDKDFIFIKFVAFNSKFNSFSSLYNDELYKGDVCEVFFKYGEANHYYEIEVAPNGAKFYSNITNINGNFSGKLIDTCPIKTEVKKYHNKYIVFIVIPKNLIKAPNFEFNAFRIDTDGEVTNKHLFALIPTMCGSFHKNLTFKKIKL